MPDPSFFQLLLLLVSLPYVLGPLLVFFSIKSMALPVVKPIAAQEVPAEIQPLFQQTAATLRPEGFELAGFVDVTGIVQGNDCYALLMLDSRAGVVAGAYHLRPQQGQPLAYVELAPALSLEVDQPRAP